MKKIAPIAAIALFSALAMTSCKKDYKCTCSATVGGQTISATTDLGKQKKKDAEKACTALQVTSGGVSSTCKLD